MSKRPYVVVNVAQSINGYISGSGGRRVVISSPEDMVRVHGLRSDVDAILVGSGTVITDDPRLVVDPNVAEKAVQPTRVILDRSLRTSESARVFDSSAKTILYTLSGKGTRRNCELRERDVQGLSLENILQELEQEGIRKILVEGGKKVITGFIEGRMVDEFYIYLGDVIIEEGGMELFSPGFEIRNVIKEVVPLGKGVLISLDPYHLQRLWKTQVKDT